MGRTWYFHSHVGYDHTFQTTIPLIKFILNLFIKDVAQEQEAEGDLILSDLGDGVPFRPGIFDGAIR